MFLFYRLLLAHFIADYPLQWSGFLRWKVKSVWGRATHSAIHVLISLLLLLPYANIPAFWLFLALLFLTHFFQDWLKIFIFYGKKHDDVFTFLIDQVLHFAVLACILFFPFSREVRLIPWFGTWYNNPYYMLLFLGLVAATFTGAVLLYYLRNTFVDARSGFYQDWSGMAERSAIFLLYFVGGGALWLIPLAIALRIPFYFASFLQVRHGFDIILRGGRPIELSRKVELKGDIAIDLIGSPAWAIICALVIDGLIKSF